MRMFLLFILLLLPINVYAANCNIFTNSQDIAGCISEEGCEWKGTACGSCSENTYCPQGGGGTNCQNGACACPAEFPNSTAGTIDEQDCYKPCSTNSDNISYTIINCGITKYSVDSGSAYVSCKDNAGVLTLWTASDDYHAETSIDTEGEYGCYLNSRPCHLFSAKDKDGEEINNPDYILGTALWDDDARQYSVFDASDPNGENTCQYKLSDVNNTNYHCVTDVVYETYNHPYGQQFVPNASTPLLFNQLYSYYCKSCLDDDNVYYYPNPATPATSYTGCKKPDGNYHKVCSCTAILQGFYQTQPWDYALDPTPETQYFTECPTGQTTLNASGPYIYGGSGIGDCVYTADTQFCDDGGCFNLGNIPNLTPAYWQQVQ